MAKMKVRSDGRFVKTFTFNGKRYSAYGRTQKEATEKAEAKKQWLKEGAYTKTENLTVNQYYDRLEDNKRGTVKDSSLNSNRSAYNSISNIAIDKSGKMFGDLKLKEVERQNVIDLQKSLERLTKEDGSPKYKVTTINYFIRLVKHIFNNAVNDEILVRNPARGLKSLKEKEVTAVKTIHRALSKVETMRFFEAAKDSYYFPLFQFLICSGCRIGEAGALKKSDINYKENRIEIRRTLTRSFEGSFIVGNTTKTADGKRDIPLTDGIRLAINNQRNQASELGLPYRLDSLIFVSVEGKLLHANMVNVEIKKICSRIGIDKFTCHAFRDTFATRAIESGMNPKTLQMILGHSDIGITMNLYCHVMEETKVQEMNKVVLAM